MPMCAWIYDGQPVQCSRVVALGAQLTIRHLGNIKTIKAIVLSDQRRTAAEAIQLYKENLLVSLNK